METVSEGVRDRDMEAILSAYADDAVIYDVRDHLMEDKEGLRRSWAECFDSSTRFEYKIKDFKLEIDDNVAFSFCLSHCLGLTNEGQNIDLWLRVSTCYAKRNGKWRVVHEHVSVPGDFSTGKILQDLKPESFAHA